MLLEHSQEEHSAKNFSKRSGFRIGKCEKGRLSIGVSTAFYLMPTPARLMMLKFLSGRTNSIILIYFPIKPVSNYGSLFIGPFWRLIFSVLHCFFSFLVLSFLASRNSTCLFRDTVLVSCSLISIWSSLELCFQYMVLLASSVSDVKNRSLWKISSKFLQMALWWASISRKEKDVES